MSGGASANDVAWNGQRGINIMWPFLGPLVVDPNDPNTEYQTNPFTNPAAFVDHATPAVLARVKAAGFDHVRLPVAPGPWMDAIAAGNETRIEYLFTLFDAAVDACIAAGLGVMIDMHDSYYVKNMPPELLASGISSAIWLRRIEITKRFAARYASKPKDKLCLELFNEPLAAGSISGLWKDYLWSLYQVARTAMPNHTLLLTAENYSSIDQLVAFDPRPYGNNVLWAIHPYIPAIFAIQGYNQSSYNKYVSGLEYPPDSSKKSAAIAAMTANVNADGSLTSGQKTATIASQTQELNYYFDVPLGASWIGSEFQKVADWCASYGLSANRIIANEYGVTRTNVDFTGAPAASRVAYLNAVGPLLWNRGFRSSIFSLDAVDYGITDGTGQDIGNFLPGLTLSA